MGACGVPAELRGEEDAEGILGQEREVEWAGVCSLWGMFCERPNESWGAGVLGCRHQAPRRACVGWVVGRGKGGDWVGEAARALWLGWEVSWVKIQ